MKVATPPPDRDAFRTLIDPYTAELQRHCYRMLGSAPDAEDAMQEVLVKAWRALPRFEGRSSLRTWLFRIATNTCVNMIKRNPRRVLRIDGSDSGDSSVAPGEPLSESVWIGPLPEDLPAAEYELPERRYEEKEALELAFVAALQHLTARQRAVLVLREVLGFSGAEVASMLETNPDSVHSLLQRAHRTVDDKLPTISQRQVARSLGEERMQLIVERYVDAWHRGDADALAAMLAKDAVLSMPPRPTWFRGRDAVRAFVAREPMAPGRRWHLEATRCNGQLAFDCTLENVLTGEVRSHALQVLTLGADGRIGEITAFLET